ncbi:cytosine methyltransferase [Gluconobacter oxydans]|uniref:Cytosine-specific methyltransferase n=2 Tax=Gluconobacter oxydans TaxID=442 RepID=A0AB34XN65_GLUOY|nr:DNA (cytosine-5-)-methyltransferase [Gluconobacter oxydans]AHK70078.1 putative restriction endonuclease EcoRII [Gluconobacter oxydans DSM 3504]KXV09765.1 cytosine methyltransferase [Gluconobacter oxydans]
MARSPKISSSFSRLREQAGLTLKEAAESLGISESTASRYENGKLNIAPPVMKLLDRLIEERRQSRAVSQPGFRFVDLFAGIGGLRIGFESIGGHCVFTSEWDRFSKQTYALNYPDNHEISGDIRPFSEDPSLVPEHDVLLAGFPCQPFSLAGVSKKNSLGRPHGFLCDMQGTLFFDTARIIAHHRPAAFLLENVKNLQRHDKGRTFAVIMATLRDKLGYHVQARVISSAPWVPQKRERIFIVGFREKTDFDLDKLEIPSVEHGPKLGSILDPNESVDPKYTLTEHLWNYLQNYKAKHEAKGNGFGYGLFGPDDVARTLSARYHKDGSEILIRQDGKRPRRLTPQECARLMGFERPGRPFRIGVSDTQAYRQFGNAVVVPVIEHLAEAMAPYIQTVMQTSEDPERRKELSSASVEVPIG